ncbi:glycoside hydrolase 5 family protein [Bifidobacterium platyrrhinorum]|uniref:Glycosyl hydrolase n=1 Tax=Bifidobacterium platyrrhinorum TaxID=2661628 RepID=A0A6L9SRK0_9BIFI|nr:glycosyl hydrolase [Bifidobacterium platyrrhinorum]NEG54393.1 glycosyl hydrolase [Bifidobacterium platyrrhinorum]
MKFGVDYTPSHGWFHSWLDPDWTSIDRDLKQIADLGLDHVRIFPVWPYLQPNRTWINRKGVDDVRRMVRLAGDHGLDAYVDVFQGHLSSFDFIPSWLVTWHAGNMFTDPDAVAAERELVSVMNDALSGEANFRGITLGNEVNQLSDRPHPTKMTATPAQIDAWLDELLPAAGGDGRSALYSVNDGVWFIDGHPFTPVQSATKGDMTTIHSWVFNGIAQGYGARSEECHSYALYLAELSKAFGPQDRPVWLQEVGAPENVLDVADTPEFCRRTVEKALDCTNLWGVTWWCSHDVPASMSDFPFFEHSLGLFDERGELKPIGRVYGELARRYRDMERPAAKHVAVVVDVDADGNPRDRATLGPGGSVCDLWMDLETAGKRPTIVTSAVAADPAELARRGVTELHVDEHPHPARFYTAVSDPSFDTAD